MFKSLIASLVLAASFFVFDSSEAEAHRRWVVRRPIARAVVGPPVVRRAYRPYYRPVVGPRVYVGVGVGWGGGYYW